MTALSDWLFLLRQGVCGTFASTVSSSRWTARTGTRWRCWRGGAWWQAARATPAAQGRAVARCTASTSGGSTSAGNRRTHWPRPPRRDLTLRSLLLQVSWRSGDPDRRRRPAQLPALALRAHSLPQRRRVPGHVCGQLPLSLSGGLQGSALRAGPGQRSPAGCPQPQLHPRHQHVFAGLPG